MGTTPNLKLPIPELTETADGPDAFSDLALATEGYVYNRVLPAGVVRVPNYYWGVGTSLPTGTDLRAGDTYRHTGLGCLMAYNGAAWRQAGVSVAANQTARLAISTSHAAALHESFRIWQTDTGAEWAWNGASWELVGMNQAILYKDPSAGNVAQTSLVSPPKLYLATLGASMSNISFWVGTFGYAAAGFTEVPQIFLSTGGENSAALFIGYDAASATQCTVIARSNANVTLNYPISCLAIGR